MKYTNTNIRGQRCQNVAKVHTYDHVQHALTDPGSWLSSRNKITLCLLLLSEWLNYTFPYKTKTFLSRLIFMFFFVRKSYYGTIPILESFAVFLPTFFSLNGILGNEVRIKINKFSFFKKRFQFLFYSFKAINDLNGNSFLLPRAMMIKKFKWQFGLEISVKNCIIDFSRWSKKRSKFSMKAKKVTL